MRDKNRAFTLIELIIVMGVSAILLGIVGASYSGVRSRINFENQVEEITADLRWTMSRSVAQESNDQWGIRFDNPSGEGGDFYEIWHGDSYDAGTVVSRVNLHGSVAFSDPEESSSADVIFLKATGLPTASSTLELKSLSGDSTATIDINTQGRIDATLN